MEVVFHETKEGYKTWRGIDLSFQNCHRYFGKFWLEHSKASNIFTLMGSFWAEYILSELKKYRGVTFHETEEGYKIWRGIDLSFQNWHKEFDKFWLEHSKVLKTFISIGSFGANYILFLAEKVQRSYLSWNWRRVQNLERNWLLSFQNRHKEFDKFWLEHSKVSTIFTLMGSFWTKYILFELKMYRGVISHDIEECNKIWRKTDLLLEILLSKVGNVWA